ncbi:MAG: PepSY domain-containing protein [Sphingomonadales bacterium]|nr:PepSY domain-containing protein [Sphingomonadales bacterium]
MRVIDLLHRWTGGVIGLLLAIMGLSGTLLVNADSLFSPAIHAPARTMPLSGVVAEAERGTASRTDYIIFASPDFPFHRVTYNDGSGRFLDTGGAIVARWQSQWQRPELWLFDLHRYLFIGKNGETIVGIAAMLGLGFVVTGTILWWQRRRTFAPRFWPSRMTRSAIVRHHRDLGILLAPLLCLSFTTGAMMALKPVGLALVSPWSSAREIEAATAKPIATSQPPAVEPHWQAIFAEAQRRFPQAETRLLSFPVKPGDLIQIRMRQPQEWLPNGHTNLWFAPGDGHLIATKDARTLPTGATILDRVYPLHAAKVGGFLTKLIMTISGIGLALLGSFAVWSFWFKRPQR